MAATVSPWGKPGAWALDAEENESELLQQTKEDCSAPLGGETPDFPSLSSAASSKTKKKKPQALSLQEFSAYSSPKPKGLTHDELSALPTGPRERSAEELDRNKLGGGFRSYGGGSRDEQPRHQGSFNRESGRELGPSRADETDDWGANKKTSGSTGFERRERGERGGFFGDTQSRADEVDNWASNKNFAPSEPRRYEKRGGFGLESADGGSDSSNWGKRKEEEGRRSGGAFDSLRERRGGMEADSESWGRKREESSGGNRPRLNLQPRTLPVNEEGKSEDTGIVKPKGSNPFGEARPREEVLKEKAQDMKEIEEKLEVVTVDSDGQSIPKRSVWSGRERMQPEDRTDKSWRKLDSVDPPQSGGETEDGHADNDDTENKKIVRYDP
ncbi:eukaryotic translation initiation factor 4B3-like [Salvia miltiorrhiza]|uniref:eukaryotic translation initiation factor 4B3-like n=1 Tax=Salvia miltiorrhiza TaxID=226208 RepID=UPI0025AC1357|nr:eukaryotic translation initiation factor 4B3-like [Salvia miltiorrhiza]